MRRRKGAQTLPTWKLLSAHSKLGKKVYVLFRCHWKQRRKHHEYFLNGIFSFLTVESFLSEKKFTFESGNRVVKIERIRLFSVEIQLLILFIEALLQRQTRHVFLVDEPEISLHIDWQRRIRSAMTELNPEAQVLAATHSPEVASEYPDNLIDMRDMVANVT